VSSIAEDVTKQKQDEDKIEYMSYHDTLTNMPNRTLFYDRLKQECLYADREKTIVGILFMGIDHFKVINDTLGHMIGDLLLKDVSHRLRDNFRSSDTVSRFGGDTFAIIIPYLSQSKDLFPIYDSVIRKFEKPFKVLEHEFFITFSTGISFYPLNDTEHDKLISDADSAMYYAKSHGRNQYQCYNNKMTEEANKYLDLQNGLKHAIDNKELILYYQPQTSSQSTHITGVEALLRWDHPEKGLISPADFIPIAEQTGLIVPIGEWVLRTACKQVKVWEANGYSNITMAVNLSSRQFQDEEFVQKVINIKNEYALHDGQLELELTESILMDNDSSVLKDLQVFKEEGILLAIDDFGTGYSSLSYLNLFPIDKLKIDQSFTKNVTNDLKIATLVRAIISMAKALGLETIAEGVETQEQQDFIQREGCDTIQGYFRGRPMPAEEIEDLLKNR
jgi:diguanylate cyclase (GGDEF)-like protein